MCSGFSEEKIFPKFSILLKIEVKENLIEVKIWARDHKPFSTLQNLPQ